jgi:N-carbamoyl-L-amino-acid hydrolase
VATPLDLRIDGARLWDSLTRLAEIGATGDGGCERLALTDLDDAAHGLVAGWLADLGCRVRRDRVGNLFAERVGRHPARGYVLVGSHLDTQPKGGRFDGAYGVLAALEIVRTLKDAGIETDAAVTVVSWTNEEGARFPQPLTGSGVFTGAVPLDDARAQPAVDGPRFGDELDRLGIDPTADGPPPGAVEAYFETHIEQGPQLESTGNVIGVVRGGQGIRALRVVLEGAEAHAGTTPMDRRRDAALAAARVVEAAHAVALRTAGALVTVGQLSIEPGSRAVIPGRATLVVDMRHPDRATLDAVEEAIRAAVAKVGADAGVRATAERFLDVKPVRFDRACNDAVSEAARRLGYPSMELVSGAGHDAMNLARIAPTALVFIPCQDGVSHTPAEYASPQHAEAGCNVLLHAVLATAGVASR